MPVRNRREREREARRGIILEAARDVIASRGFEASTVESIALEAEFTKRTLYQYFPSKEDILFALGAAVLADIPLAGRPDETGSAYDRLERFARDFYARIRDRPRDAAVMEEALSLRGSALLREGARAPAEGERGKLESELQRLYGHLSSLIGEGMADGSLRGDVLVEGAAFALFFLFRSFLGFVARGEAGRVSAGGNNGDRLALYALDLVLKGMRRDRA